MKQIIIFTQIVSLCLFYIKGHAQSKTIIHSGTISFEKRENVYAILNEQYATDGNQEITRFASSYKVKYPQFKLTHFSLSFNDKNAIYMPSPDQNDNIDASFDFLKNFAAENVVNTDLTHLTSLRIKSVFGKKIFIADSLPRLNWKLTGETKDIAGFTCHRANAILMDSIYVVAFYTDQIVPQAGPESFAGLPGMILGLILPHEHVSWFANGYVSAETLNNVANNKNKVSAKEFNDVVKNLDQLKDKNKRNSFIIKRLLL